MASALGSLAGRGTGQRKSNQSSQSPGPSKQAPQQSALADEQASPQQEGTAKGKFAQGKNQQQRKSYLGGQSQKARPVMAPPQNVKIQQKDTGNQPSLLNDADLVQDDDMAMAGKPSIIVSPVDQLDQM